MEARLETLVSSHDALEETAKQLVDKITQEASEQVVAEKSLNKLKDKTVTTLTKGSVGGNGSQTYHIRPLLGEGEFYPALDSPESKTLLAAAKYELTLLANSYSSSFKKKPTLAERNTPCEKLFVIAEKIKLLNLLHTVHGCEFFDLPDGYKDFERFIKDNLQYLSLLKSFEFRAPSLHNTSFQIRLRKPINDISEETWQNFKAARASYCQSKGLDESKSFQFSQTNTRLSLLPIKIDLLTPHQGKINYYEIANGIVVPCTTNLWEKDVFKIVKGAIAKNIADAEDNPDEILFQKTYERLRTKFDKIRDEAAHHPTPKSTKLCQKLNSFQNAVGYLFKKNLVSAFVLRNEVTEFLELLDGNRDISTFQKHAQNLKLGQHSPFLAWLGGAFVMLAGIILATGLIFAGMGFPLVAPATLYATVAIVGGLGLFASAASKRSHGYSDLESSERALGKLMGDEEICEMVMGK